MGENICRRSRQQGINLQNIQTSRAAQYKKNQTTQSKNGQKIQIDISPKRHTDGLKAHEKMLNNANY